MLYFAYGSNMSLRRIRHRVPSAHPVATATLMAHRLAFHKVGRDGSAKCDIAPGRHDVDRVHGVVYRMDPRHRGALDLAEGLGNGYEVKTVELFSDDQTITAFTYYATHTDSRLQPYAWYLKHVLYGAREHGLPAHYVALIGAVEAIDDPDDARAQAEFAIHRQMRHP
jgi:hypothetical protein